MILVSIGFSLFVHLLSMPLVISAQLESRLSMATWLLKGAVYAADFKTYIFPFDASPVEACVVCRTQKPKARRGKILCINAVNEITRERAQSFLTDEHLQHVVLTHQDFKDEPGFTRVVPIEGIRAKEGNLSIPLYVGGETQGQTGAATETATMALPDALTGWLSSSAAVRSSLESLLSLRKSEHVV